MAIVTGAANGIGRATVARLVADGRRVALLDLDGAACSRTAAELAARGGEVEAYACDVADANALRAAVDGASRSLGPPTILVSNAGFARDRSLSAMSEVDWDDVHDVHLRALFLLAKLTTPTMTREGWGRIVAVSSISALGHAERVNYCAAKAGIEGFIRGVAAELAPFGITANAVAPGLIRTGMTSVTASRRGLSVEEHLRAAASSIPVGRAGEPEDVANAISFFTSEQCGFVTGQVLTVSGGVTV